MKMNFAALVAIATTLLSGCATAQKTGGDSFTNWPAGTSPAEVGRRVAENFTARKFEFESGKRKTVIYPEVITWYGSLTVARLTGDTNLQARLARKFDFFLTPEGAARVSTNAHVDYRVFGIVPLELYLQTRDVKLLALGKSFADKQWQNPAADGITAEARYWVDDMYMITALQVQAFRATGDAQYLDRAALTVAAYLDKLQQPNGLFFHAADSPFFWARGNGWFAAGMTELLSDLPANHPQRARILAGYKTMMAALLKFQSDEGRWRQLVDKPESWLESSGTGMFAFALVTGVKRGWLDEKIYGPAARKAWLALVKNLDADANVKDVCVGTNKGAKEGFQEAGADLDAQLKFYLARGRETGNLHGQAPILWTAGALLR
jgi:rhamnogalacturonyl hydrolase YesR